MQSNGNNQLNDSIPEWTSIIAVLSQNWSTPSYRGAMKLERKALLWMPAKNRRKKKKKTPEKKRRPKIQKRRNKEEKEKERRHQARHTSSWRSSSIGRFRSVSCYFGSRFLSMQGGRILKLSVGKASVLI